MNRIQIDLTDAQLSALGAIAERTGRSQSDLIRQAVDGYIARHSAAGRRELLRAAQGLWRDRDDLQVFCALRGE